MSQHISKVHFIFIMIFMIKFCCIIYAKYLPEIEKILSKVIFEGGIGGGVIPTFLNQTILDKIWAKDFCLKRTTPLALPRRWSFFERIFWSAAFREWLPKNSPSQTREPRQKTAGSAICADFLEATLDKQRTKICVQKMTIVGEGQWGSPFQTEIFSPYFLQNCLI